MENSKVNIFDEVDFDKKNFFKFDKVGDKVQGVYIARNDDSIDGYHNPQTLVDLLQDDQTVKTVSIRHNKTGLLEELDKTTFGQIIGFVFTGTKDNPGKQATKYIRLVQDPKFVDETWLAEYNKKQEAEKNPTAGMTPEQIFPTPVAPVAPATPVAPVAPEATTDSLEASLAASVMTDAEKTREIANLVKAKLGATSLEEIKAKIVETTGLELVTANLDAILTKLQSI